MPQGPVNPTHAAHGILRSNCTVFGSIFAVSGGAFALSPPPPPTDRVRAQIHTQQPHAHTHTQDHHQCKWHIMTRMTGPDCAVMGNLINTHTHKRTQVIIDPPLGEDQCEWHRVTRMAGLDYAVMSNLINTHTHTHTSDQRFSE